MIELNKEGWMFSTTTRWWEENPKRVYCNDYDVNTGITIENIGGVFVVIAVGILAATFILIYEFFYFTYWREKMERFYNKNLKKLKSIISLRRKVKRINVEALNE